MEKNIKIEFDSNSIGEVSKLTESQINSLSTNSTRLRNDLIYFIPKQKVHNESMMIRGAKRNSNKVFAFGCIYDADKKSLSPVSVTTLSINGLRQRHYGLTANGPIVAEAEMRDGVWRMKAGQNLPQTSVFAKGGVACHIASDNTATVDQICFAVTGRNTCHTIGMSETEAGSNKYNFDHENRDGKEYVKFQATDLNTYEEVLGMPVATIGDCAELCEQAKAFLVE